MDSFGFSFDLGEMVASTSTSTMAMLAAEAQGLAFSFIATDLYPSTGFFGGAAIKDTGTPANNYDSSPDKTASSLLTYTAPSVKMCMGPSGTLRYQAHNLVTYSEQFDNAAWTKAHATISANAATAPDGTTTADAMLEAATAGAKEMYQFATASVGEVTWTIYVKGLNRTWCYLSAYSDAANKYTWFDLSGNGAVGTNAAGSTASIANVGNGWYRLIVTRTVAATSVALSINPTTADNTLNTAYTGNTSNGLYVWGAHIRRTPSDSTYLATTTAARYALPIEWSSAGVLQGLLVEESRTNLALYASDFTNAAWTKSNMTTAKTATGPDGVANSATTLTATAGNATALQAITSGSAARISNVWIKRRTGSGTVNITSDNGTTWTAVTVTSSWTRVESTVQTLTNPTVGIRIVTSGDEVDVALFGHEVGSFSTSAIETFASTVTRAADQITFPNTIFPWSASAWTVFAEYNAGPNGSYILDATFVNRVVIYRAVADPAGFADTGCDITWGSSGVATGDAIKHALAATTNDCQLVVNGASRGTDTAFTPASGQTTFYVGYRYNGTDSLNSHLKKLMIVPRRMSQAELVTLTT